MSSKPTRLRTSHIRTPRLFIPRQFNWVDTLSSGLQPARIGQAANARSAELRLGKLDWNRPSRSSALRADVGFVSFFPPNGEKAGMRGLASHSTALFGRHQKRLNSALS